ncbi:hypothetical protein AMECASPLE_031861 [Ameca splendens]|uniref:Uncharacterized protein n=1 Tax=Ameca splendens TaxID=208324 RepID=A0ABV0YHI3_9TELE
MKARNMAHLDSKSPNSPRMCLKLSRRWELKLHLTGDFARRSQQTLKLCLGLLGLTGILPIGASSPPGSQWKAQGSNRQGFRLRSPPIPHCTRPLWPLSRVMSPSEGGPMFPFCARLDSIGESLATRHSTASPTSRVGLQ